MQQSNPQQRPPRSTPKKGHLRRESNLPPRSVRPVRNYASENDIPRDSSAIRTPRKGTPGASNSNSAANPGNSAFKGNSGGQRNRNKGRPTSIAIGGSPGPSKPGRTTPPLTAGKASAYAGATYHASPAPNSLPIPSFLKKGVGSPGNRKPISQEPSPPPSDSETTSPSITSSVPRKQEPTIHDSPLEFFFRKDREEKERTRGASQSTVSSSPFGASDLSPLGSLDRQAPAPSTGRRPSLASRSVAGISPDELNGNPGYPIGPAFSTPFNDRIRATRTGATSSHASPASTGRSPEERTQALKNLLSIGKQGSPSRTGGPNPFAPACNTTSPPAHRQQPIHSLSTGGQVGPAADVTAMTNNLKNLLRIK